MERVWSEGSTVLERMSLIFNNRACSDVTFVVGRHDMCRFYGHKFLLSLASPAFVELLKNSASQVPIQDISAEAFYKMLRYIYMDEVLLKNAAEAQELNSAAKKYKLAFLQKRCEEYICQNEITVENACSLYETAKNVPLPSVLEECDRIFYRETMAVLISPGFLESSLATVETIVKKDCLNINSELDIIEAVIRWGGAQCEEGSCDEQGVNERIQKIILPLLKYLRVLTLELDEFLSFIEKYPVLSPLHSSIITAKILNPEKVQLPPELCSIATSRYKGDFKDVSSLHNRKLECYKTQPSSSLQFVARNDHIKEYECAISTDKNLNALSRKTVLNNGRDNSDSSEDEASPSEEEEENEIEDENGEVFSCPLKLDKKSPLINELPLIDFVSKISICVLKGNIILHGLKFFFKRKHEEKIPSYRCVIEQVIESERYEENHVITDKYDAITFKEKLFLLNNNKIDITVAIEDLQRKYCSFCTVPQFIFENRKKDVSFRVTVSSKQKNKANKIPFIISHILYSTSKM